MGKRYRCIFTWNLSDRSTSGELRFDTDNIEEAWEKINPLLESLEVDSDEVTATFVDYKGRLKNKKIT